MKILPNFMFVLLLAASTFSVLAAPVNINSASADDIANSLKGVGATKATAIVQYRQQNGSFTSVEELALVKGISHKTVEKNRGDILLSDQ